MNDRTYLEHLMDLTIKLTNAVENDGYRSDAYNEVLKEIAVFGARFNRSRHRCSYCTTWIIMILLFLFALILCSILF